MANPSGFVMVHFPDRDGGLLLEIDPTVLNASEQSRESFERRESALLKAAHEGTSVPECVGGKWFWVARDQDGEGIVSADRSSRAELEKFMSENYPDESYVVTLEDWASEEDWTDGR